MIIKCCISFQFARSAELSRLDRQTLHVFPRTSRREPSRTRHSLLPPWVPHTVRSGQHPQELQEPQVFHPGRRERRLVNHRRLKVNLARERSFREKCDCKSGDELDEIRTEPADCALLQLFRSDRRTPAESSAPWPGVFLHLRGVLHLGEHCQHSARELCQYSEYGEPEQLGTHVRLNAFCRQSHQRQQLWTATSRRLSLVLFSLFPLH